MNLQIQFKHIVTTAILLLPHLSIAAPGDIYYVDTNHASASDTYTKTENSETQPWKTIQRAADILTEGETVLVKDGTYTELARRFPNEKKLAVKPQNSGSIGKPITYKAFPGHRPKIDQNFLGAGFYMEGRHYITIDGFEITRISQGGVWNNYGCASNVACSTYITVQNNLIHDQDGGGNEGGIKFDGVSFGLIKNNIIHTIRVDGDVRQFNSAAIHSFNMGDTVIENNELYNSGNGIYHKQAPTDGSSIIIRNNIIHDVDRGALFTNAGSKSPPHMNQSFHNNIVYNAGRCVNAKQKDTPKQSNGLKVYSNVFDNCTLESNGFLNNEFYNNIYYMDTKNRQLLTETGDPKFWESTIIYSDYNNYFPEFQVSIDLFDTNANYSSLTSWKNACLSGCPETLAVTSGPGKNSLAVDPQFVDRAAHNYKLKSTSALKGKGRFIGDIGAYTIGNELIGPTISALDPRAPKPPSNITPK